MHMSYRKPATTALLLVSAIVFTGCGDQGSRLPAGVLGTSSVGVGAGTAGGDLDDPVLAGYDGTDSVDGLVGDDPYDTALNNWNETEGSMGGLEDASFDDFDDSRLMDAGYDGGGYGAGSGSGYGYGGGYGNDYDYGYGGYGSGVGIASAGGYGGYGGGMMDAGFEDPGMMDAGFEDPGFADPGFDAGMGGVDAGFDPGIADAGITDVGMADVGMEDVGMDVGGMDAGVGFDDSIAVF